MRRSRGFFSTLIFGLVVGWVARSIGVDATERQHRLTMEKVSAETKINQLLDKTADTEILRQQLAEAQAEITRLKAALAKTPPAASKAVDRLDRINGIGPKFAQRLNEAGIRTFADVAQASPDELRKLVQAKAWQKIDPEGWITQAAALSK